MPSGGSAPVGGRPPAGSADSIFVLKSRRFGKRGGGLCAHRAGPSVADGRARQAGPRPLMIIIIVMIIIIIITIILITIIMIPTADYEEFV